MTYASNTANKKPTRNDPTAAMYKERLKDRSLVQLRAATGSIGQGNRPANQIAAPLMANNIAATPNTPTLCSLSQTS